MPRPPSPDQAPRVVIDTNVVLSALVFASPLTARMRDAWVAGAVVPLASTATAAELVRVLAYPKFQLSPSMREELLSDYLPWVVAVTISDPSPRVPRCRDPDDRHFLELAVAGHADMLVTGDGDLHALAEEVPFEIVAPATLLARLG
ncbi:MAG: putative toxin-antitoxin system toxin component, PIN family [Burkholderiales bacterium]|nr:putative toxin-antitoxin system toxin component, PIN family [Burkholderiales bacterium]